MKCCRALHTVRLRACFESFRQLVDAVLFLSCPCDRCVCGPDLWIFWNPACFWALMDAPSLRHLLVPGPPSLFVVRSFPDYRRLTRHPRFLVNEIYSQSCRLLPRRQKNSFFDIVLAYHRQMRNFDATAVLTQRLLLRNSNHRPIFTQQCYSS